MLSNQFRTHVILLLQIWASTFLTSLKIFQQNFAPFLTSLSSSCLTFHLLHQISASRDLNRSTKPSWFLCIWIRIGIPRCLSLVSSELELCHHCKNRSIHLCDLLPSAVYISISLSIVSDHCMIWVLWYNFCFIDFCPWVLVCVLKWVFLHGLIFDLSFFFIYFFIFILICTWVFLFIISVLLKWVFLSFFLVVWFVGNEYFCPNNEYFSPSVNRKTQKIRTMAKNGT